jgi:DnaJ-class molecular chaperone
MTHYNTLGVQEDATAEDIKRAYRKLASQHHPDRGGDTGKFQAIEQAYRVLSDDAQRQRYDMERKGGGPGGFNFHFNHGHPDLDSIFQQFGFGFGSPFGQPQPQRRNKDLRIEIPIPLVTTLEEQSKTISVQTTNGERTTVEVKIPRGVTSGTTIKYAGLGDNLFNTLPRGDLYVHIAVHPAEGFANNGVDLHTQVHVNCLTAIAGGEVTVAGLDGRTFNLNLQPGTQPGVKFRIPGHGLWLMNTAHRGDLYVEMVLTVPQNFTEEQLEIVRTLLNPQ